MIPEAELLRRERISKAMRGRINNPHGRPRLLTDEEREHNKFNSHLRHNYGITVEEYKAILAAQHGTCACCSATNSGDGQRLHVDHCHATGIVRGLLCDSCNRMLGQARDNPSILRAGAEYLERQ